jgi:hypothetical protein
LLVRPCSRISQALAVDASPNKGAPGNARNVARIRIILLIY